MQERDHTLAAAEVAPKNSESPLVPPRDLVQEQEPDHTAAGEVPEPEDKKLELGHTWLVQELVEQQKDHTTPEPGARPFPHTDWRAELPLPIGVAAVVSAVVAEAANIAETAVADTVHTEELGLPPEGQHTDRGSADRRQTFSNRISSPEEMTGGVVVFSKTQLGKRERILFSTFTSLV